jgi:drug/metabolite transporter (DMT)-like permease
LLTAALRAPDRPMAGIGIMVAFCVVAPFIDVFAKLASVEATALQIAVARFAVQTAALAPVALALGRLRLPDRRAMAAHGARGALLGVATWLLVTALARMPLADAFAIFFVEPLILTLLSPWLLGEKVGWRRLTACFIGFLGALLVIRPSFAAFGWLALAPVGAAVAFALYLVLTRRQATGTDGVTMQLWAGLSGALVLGAALFLARGAEGFALGGFSVGTLVLMAGVGLVSAVSHLMIAAAFARAPASTLAPFQYLELLSVTLLGALIWGHIPAASTWAGMAVIVGSGLYVFRRERALNRGS